MAKATIRAYRAEDRAAVRRICYETGHLGGPVRDHYRDFESFADIFSSYYTDQEPEHALVAELDGAVVGYIFSCLDSQRAWSPQTIALKHALLRGVCFRPGTAGFYWRGLWDSITDLARPGRPKFDLTRFPSHTHNNLLPEGRGASVGTAFFLHVFDMLKRAGSNGLHGEIAADNTTMIDFITKRLGYELVGEPYLVQGGRLADGRRMYLRLVLRDLSDWVPGAWQSASHRTRLADPRAL